MDYPPDTQHRWKKTSGVAMSSKTADRCPLGPAASERTTTATWGSFNDKSDENHPTKGVN